MKRIPNPAAQAAGLRRRAEAQLRKQRRPRPPVVGAPGSTVELRRVLHELQVHQVELELQNAELQVAQDRLEILLEKYTDLYDFAPTGYFSLDPQGRILEANLTAAVVLGVERSRLVGRNLASLVAPACQGGFRAFLERVFSGSGSAVCEVTLLKAEGGAFRAHVQGSLAVSANGPRTWCRVAVSDLTSLKRAQEAQRQLEALAVTNQELQEEILRRQTVEAALKRSEQEQRQLLDQSRRMEEQLRHLSHQILRAQEEERKRISRELHDEVTQTLVGISVQLETLARGAVATPQTLRQRIRRTQRLVDRSVSIVHQFARELRPTALDDLGLIAALHSFMKEFMKRTGIRVHFTTFSSARIPELDHAQRTALYRVAQEALTNVAHHAQASEVKVSLQRSAHDFLLAIADNGRSFEVERVWHGTGIRRLGLLGMRERVEMLGGQFRIESSPGQGTTIRAQIPLRRSPTRRAVGRAKHGKGES